MAHFGAVREFISTSMTESQLVPFEGNYYFDDRMFVLEVRSTVVSGKGGRWTLITRRNMPGFFPYRIDEFLTRNEAINLLEQVEPQVPRISLGGVPPDPIPSLEELRAWQKSIGLVPPYIEPEIESGQLVFELYAGERLNEIIESQGFDALQWGDTAEVNISPEAQAAWNWRIGGVCSPFQFCETLSGLSLDRGLPWAVVTLDRPYKLMGHFLATRGSSSKMLGTCHSSGMEVPRHLLTICVMSKAVLRDASSSSQLYSAAWALLEDLPEEQSWLCLPEPLDKDWANRMEDADEVTWSKQASRTTPIIPDPE
ncbi:MAG: hypothetical protein H8E15_13945 [Planctomycetes bacterium]|nr:hypothetical protein [Planctomycetota bacterium]